MATLNLVDSAEIMAAYNAVLSNKINWLLLYYPRNNQEELALYAWGTNGLEELKTQIHDPNHSSLHDNDKPAPDPVSASSIYIGFLGVHDDDLEYVDQRGEWVRPVGGGSEGEGERKFILINYVPASNTGVRRARAQVHVRRLGMMFRKHDAILPVDSLSRLTNATIAQALADPDPSIFTFSTSPASLAGAGPPPTTGSSSLPVSPTYEKQYQDQNHQRHQRHNHPLHTKPPTSILTDMGRVFPTFSKHAPAPAPDQNQNQIQNHPLPPTPDSGRNRYNKPLPPPNAPNPKLITRSVSEPPHNHYVSYIRPSTLLPTPGSSAGPPSASKNMFSGFLRRKKRPGSGSGSEKEKTADYNHSTNVEESQDSDDSAPPPTPPKDKGIFAPASGVLAGARSEEEEEGEVVYGYRLGFNVSEFAVISHEDAREDRRIQGESEGDVVVIKPDDFNKPLPAPHLSSPRQKGKWAGPAGLSAIKDPAERARLRMEMQRRKEEEERAMLQEEEARQEKRKREKEEFLRREEEEVERRKMAIQAEAARVAEERRRREEEERQEEERRRIEREEKKREERRKRMEEHMRLEEWRKEQARIAKENEKKEEEERKRAEEERMEKIKKMEKEVVKKGDSVVEDGWVTMQPGGSLVWKRRYYKFVQDTMYLYRSPKDMSQTLDILHLRGKVRGLKEPKDGYEELEAIPFSFAVEFTDLPTWSMFADSEEEKFKLLGLLHHAAGLTPPM